MHQSGSHLILHAAKLHAVHAGGACVAVFCVEEERIVLVVSVATPRFCFGPILLQRCFLRPYLLLPSPVQLSKKLVPTIFCLLSQNRMDFSWRITWASGRTFYSRAILETKRHNLITMQGVPLCRSVLCATTTWRCEETVAYQLKRRFREKHMESFVAPHRLVVHFCHTFHPV